MRFDTQVTCVLLAIIFSVFSFWMLTSCEDHITERACISAGREFRDGHCRANELVKGTR